MKFPLVMKNLPDRFGIATLVLALLLGWFALATIFAETFTPPRLAFSRSVATPAAGTLVPLAGLAAAAAPLRGDLLADAATALAPEALNPAKDLPSGDVVAARERVVTLTKQSLTSAPHSSDVWLLLAMVQSLDPQQSKLAAGALKMSYLTAPAGIELIPHRLTVFASSATADSELKDLVRGDIRLILTRRPDLRAAIANAYRRGSPEGRAYIEDSTRAIDPAFAALLRQ